jgi:hypothetical protein
MRGTTKRSGECGRERKSIKQIEEWENLRRYSEEWRVGNRMKK